MHLLMVQNRRSLLRIFQIKIKNSYLKIKILIPRVFELFSAEQSPPTTARKGAFTVNWQKRPCLFSYKQSRKDTIIQHSALIIQHCAQRAP